MSRKLLKFKRLSLIFIGIFAVAGASTPAYGMHIMEGYLPVGWAIFWWLVALPFMILGWRSLTRITKANAELKLLLALAGAFTFVSCKHQAVKYKPFCLLPKHF